jgi:ubiquinone biosynthesis protein UbiJ
MSLPNLLKSTMLSGLQAALNRGLQLDPAALERLADLAGKAIEIRLRPFDLRFFLLPGAGGIELAAQLERAPDTVLSGTPLGLLRGALSRSERRELFDDDLRIEGDTDTGRRLKAVLDGIDIDWEEQLSRLVGDVAAHQLGNLARGFGRWSQETGASLTDDLDEYLHEEARLAPPRAEVEDFLAAVDVLRSDADRLEQRVARLQRRLDAGTS